jgi:tetratricopeptide (TPR) repeat protein
LLGWLGVVRKDWPDTYRRLDQAEAIFTPCHMIQELARVQLTRGACHYGKGRLDEALAACDRAVDLAAPRNYRLIQADGLILRARIVLARGDAPAGRDDAESALQTAELCEYSWAVRDACEFLAQAWGPLGNHDEAAQYAGRAADLNRRLKPVE